MLSWKELIHGNNSKAFPSKRRILRLETLEERQLLTTCGMCLDEPDSIALGRLESSFPDFQPAAELSEDLTALQAETEFKNSADYKTLLVNKDTKNGTITVTTLSDVSSSTDGLISLREAIDYADTNDLGRVIKFHCSGTITLNGTELTLDKSVTLVGNEQITLSADRQSRVLTVSSGANVTLSGLTIKEGKVTNQGGGICNEGNLMLWKCTVTENSVVSAGTNVKGGGVYNSGTLTIFDSTISKNSVRATFYAAGGGIYSEMGTLLVTNSTISENIARAEADVYGGGIYCNAGTATLVNSLIKQNSAQNDFSYSTPYAYGGGICVNSCTMTIVNCTIDSNKVHVYGNSDSYYEYYAYAYGGGIYNHNATVNIVRSTFTQNHTFSQLTAPPYLDYLGFQLITVNPQTYSFSFGGGIYNDTGTMSVIHSTVSGNWNYAMSFNYAGGYGGGIYNKGALSLIGSNVSGNFNDVNGSRRKSEGENIYGETGSTPPDIDITVAVLAPVTELLSKKGTLTLDGSNSYNASAYWWDLNSDGTYDFKTQSPYLTLCGEEYSGAISDNMISWEDLESLGYASGDSINVTLATATATGAASLNAQTRNVKVRSTALAALGVPNFLKSALNINTTRNSVFVESSNFSIQDFAKKLAYRHKQYSVNDEVKGEDGRTYVLEEIITNNADSGFYAQVWVPQTLASDPANYKATPIVAVRGTLLEKGDSVLSDMDPQGAGYNDFKACENAIRNCLQKYANQDTPVDLTGHSLGGGQCLRIAAVMTSLGIRIRNVETYNAVGISNEQAKLLNPSNVTSITNYIVEGDFVSLAGESFLSGPNVHHIIYKVSSLLDKHSPNAKNYYHAGQSESYEISSEAFNSPLFHFIWSTSTIPQDIFINYSTLRFVGYCASFRTVVERTRRGLGFIRDITSDAQMKITANIKLKVDDLAEFTELTLKKLASGAIEVTGKLSLGVQSSLEVVLDVSQGYLSGMKLVADSANQFIANGVKLSDYANVAIQNFAVNAVEKLTLAGKTGMKMVSDEVMTLQNTITNNVTSTYGQISATAEQFTLDVTENVKEKAAIVINSGKLIYDPIRKKIESGINTAVQVAENTVSNVQTYCYDAKNKVTQLSGIGDMKIPESVPFVGGKTLKNATVDVYHSASQKAGSYVSAQKEIITKSVNKKIEVVQDFWGKCKTKGFSLLNPKPKASPCPAVMDGAAVLAADPISEYLLQLSWTSSNAAGTAVLVLADGTRIAESDFENYGLELAEDFSSDTQRTFAVLTNADVSGWTFEMTGGTDPVKADWFEFVDQEPLSIANVVVEQDASLTITVSGDVREDTVLRFYADSDSEGENGLFLFEITGADLVDGTCTWQPQNIDAGAYYLYVKTLDVSYYSEPVTIGTTVSAQVSSESYFWGSMTEYNPGADYQSKTFVITNTGTASLTLAHWTLNGTGMEVFQFEELLADGSTVSLGSKELNAGESMTVQVSLDSKSLTVGQHQFTLSAIDEQERSVLSFSGSVPGTSPVGMVMLSDSQNVLEISSAQQGSYSVVLAGRPSDTVTVYLNTEGVDTDVSTLVFTTENWNVAQTVHVSGVIGQAEGETSVIHHSIVTSDLNFLMGGLPDVVATITEIIIDCTLTEITLSANSPKVGVAMTANAVPAGASCSYQWYRGNSLTNNSAIANANSETYTPTSEDLGCFLICKATGTGNYTGTVTAISTNRVTQTLTSLTLSSDAPTAGTALNASINIAGATAVYQWYRGTSVNSMTSIPDAAKSSYTPTAEDTGYYLKCIASGTGNYTGTISATTAQKTKLQLTAPALTVSSAGDYGLKVVLGTSAGAASYTLKYSASQDFSSSQTVTYTTAGTYTIAGLAANQTYYACVMANGAGENIRSSAWSAVRSARAAQLAVQEKASTVVDTTIDVINAYDGVISLREAVMYAKAGETVTFEESMRNQTIVLDGSRIEVRKALSIYAGDKNITIDADGKSGVISVFASAKESVWLQGLTVTGGYDDMGGGIYISNGNVTIEDCNIQKNYAYGHAHGILSLAKTVTIISSKIIQNGFSEDFQNENFAAIRGDKIQMIGCVVAQNAGHGVESYSSGSVFTNCTIVGNYGNGVSTRQYSTTVNNSIVKSNGDSDLCGKTTAANSIIGTTNNYYKVTQKNGRNVDPEFVNLPEFSNYEEWLRACDEDWDLSLESGSSAINAGNNSLYTKTKMPLTSTDIAGNGRVSGQERSKGFGTIDIGAHEYQYSALAAPTVSLTTEAKKILVNWQPVSGAAWYVVDYRTNDMNKWTSKTVKKGTTLTITGKVGGTYSIRVTAISGLSGSDNAASSVSQIRLYTPLTTPKLKKVSICQTSAAASISNWSSISGKVSVQISLKVGTAAENWTEVLLISDLNSAKTLSLGGNSYDVTLDSQTGQLSLTGLRSYTSYKLKVKLFSEVASSAVSAAWSLKTTK